MGVEFGWTPNLGAVRLFILPSQTWRTKMTFEPIHILLVEDNPADIRLTQEAIKENKIKVNLHIAMDGVEAMDFLKKHSADA